MAVSPQDAALNFESFYEALDTLQRISSGEIMAVKDNSTQDDETYDASVEHLEKVQQAVVTLKQAIEEARRTLLST